jgi:hypothetical protein
MFVGMDLHKNYLQIAVMNDNGKVLENSRINNDLKPVMTVKLWLKIYII